MAEPYFREDRPLVPGEMWALLVAGAALAAILFAIRDGADAPHVALFVVAGLLAATLAALRRTTLVGPDGIVVQFSPTRVPARRVALADVANCRVESDGGPAVRIERAGGDVVVVDTDRPEELVAAVERARREL